MHIDKLVRFIKFTKEIKIMDTQPSESITRELIESCSYFLANVFIPRITKCLEHLSEEEIWVKPNENTPSVGNLLLHLGGNVQQWIVTTLGGEQDTRNRSSEFKEQVQPTKLELIGSINEIVNQAKTVLLQLDPKDLLRSHKVQDFSESGVTILIHVVEHFSYHVGQITYYVKSSKGIDLGYYSDRNLDQTN